MAFAFRLRLPCRAGHPFIIFNPAVTGRRGLRRRRGIFSGRARQFGLHRPPAQDHGARRPGARYCCGFVSGGAATGLGNAPALSAQPSLWAVTTLTGHPLGPGFVGFRGPLLGFLLVQGRAQAPSGRGPAQQYRRRFAIGPLTADPQTSSMGEPSRGGPAFSCFFQPPARALGPRLSQPAIFRF